MPYSRKKLTPEQLAANAAYRAAHKHDPEYIKAKADRKAKRNAPPTQKQLERAARKVARNAAKAKAAGDTAGASPAMDQNSAAGVTIPQSVLETSAAAMDPKLDIIAYIDTIFPFACE